VTDTARCRPPLYNATRPNARTVPASARVVIVHGSMDSSASFARLEDRLPDMNVTRYDRRGYGRSRHPGDDALDVAGHVDDLLSVLGDDPAVVLGHSFGGVIALAAAATAPDLVRGVVVYEAPMPWAPWWPEVPLPESLDSDRGELDRAAETFMRRAMGAERWDELPSDRKGSFLATAPAWATELWSAVHGTPAPYDPARIRVPVVSAYGTATDSRHTRAARVLAAEVRGAKLVQIDGADHVVHRRRPDALADLIRQLAAECAA
jgi:pimeloyl-ACP methyl ester carboxylesterase